MTQLREFFLQRFANATQRLERNAPKPPDASVEQQLLTRIFEKTRISARSPRKKAADEEAAAEEIADFLSGMEEAFAPWLCLRWSSVVGRLVQRLKGEPESAWPDPRAAREAMARVRAELRRRKGEALRELQVEFCERAAAAAADYAADIGFQDLRLPDPLTGKGEHQHITVSEPALGTFSVSFDVEPWIVSSKIAARTMRQPSGRINVRFDRVRVTVARPGHVLISDGEKFPVRASNLTETGTRIALHPSVPDGGEICLGVTDLQYWIGISNPLERLLESLRAGHDVLRYGWRRSNGNPIYRNPHLIIGEALGTVPPRPHPYHLVTDEEAAALRDQGILLFDFDETPRSGKPKKLAQGKAVAEHIDPHRV